MHLVEAAGGSARYVVADVSDESMVEAAVEAAIGDTGRLDFAVNNAGYDGEFQLTTDYSTEMLDRMIAVSMRGPPRLRRRLRTRSPPAGGGTNWRRPGPPISRRST
ncbi:SDR family oxidoreductase [Streptomyces olivaceoviridis]